MPLPALGLLGMLGNIGRAGTMGYRAFKTARAAQPAAKQLLKYEGSGLQKGLGAIAKGERKLIKKSPLTAGGLELALSAPYAAEGVVDVGQGMYEGDYGQVASGLGSLALTTPFVGRGLRIAGMSKRIPGSARDAIYQTGKETQKRIPMGKTFAPGLALTGVGMMTERGDTVASADEQVLGEPIKFTVNDVLKSVEADKQNIGKPTVIDGKEVVIGSPDYKKIAQQKLDEAYKNEQAQGTTPTATIDQIADSFTFDPSVTGGAKVVDDSLQPQAPGTTGMDLEEIQDAAERQEDQAEKGKRIKEKMANSAEADEFNRFYDRITNLTGGNDQTSNLLLFKLATGLMSGKTAQSGVRGFLDVAGQAGSGVADTALALFSKEKDRRNNLAVAFLKAKEKQKGAGVLKADKTRRTVLIEDPNDPLGGKVIDIGIEKDTGVDVMFVPTPDGSGTMVVPMKSTKYTEIKKQPARLAKYRNQLNSISQGYNYAQEVLSMPDGTFGLTGRTQLGLEKVSSVASDIFGFFGGDLSLDKSKIDRKIINSFSEDIVDEQGNVIPATEEQRKETAEVTKMYEDEIGSLLKNAKRTDGVLDNLTKARLIETRMKYVLANANKSEDRLTRADVEDAAARTQILGLTTGEDEVRSAYRNLAKNLEEQFKGIAKAYNFAGGNRDYIETFTNMPLVQAMNAEKNQQLMMYNVMKDQQNQLASIE
jgi:hypothetical protein